MSEAKTSTTIGKESKMASPLEKNIIKYENFINNVLREDLKVLEKKLNHCNLQLLDLIQQKNSLKVISDKTVYPNGYKSQVNIGCNFFMEATIPDTSKLLMNIGLNHFLEFSLPEAQKYLELLILAYEKQSKELQTKAIETKAHIKMMLIGLEQLINENKNS